jgi:hypothetical protein
VNLQISKVLCKCLALLILGQMGTFAATNVDTLSKSGPLTNRVNFAFLSEGYWASQLETTFKTDVGVIDQAFFKTTPFKEYSAFFNRFAVKVASVDTGAGYGSAKNTAFGAYFNCSGIDRLLCANSSKVTAALNRDLPAYDQAIVIVNSKKYGGAGGSYATTSTEGSAPEIAIHEVGHSFGKLADEYWAGAGYAAEQPNMTKTSSPTTVKWKDWVGTEQVGVYAHTEDPAWYRPHQNCKMRYLGTQYPFCAVCRQALVDTIWKYVQAIEGTSPSGDLTLQDQQVFQLTLVKPNPNTLRVIWTLNGKTLSRGTADKWTLKNSDLQSGVNTLRAEVLDTSAFLRSTHHVSAHVFSKEWKVSKGTITAIQTQPGVQTLRYHGNFHGQYLSLKVESAQTAPVQVRLMNAKGALIQEWDLNLEAQKAWTQEVQGLQGPVYWTIQRGSELWKEVLVAAE